MATIKAAILDLYSMALHPRIHDQPDVDAQGRHLPTMTSFSINVWSHILQSRPIFAPGSTCAKAQIRVPSPTHPVSTIAVLCWKNAMLEETPMVLSSSSASCRSGRSISQMQVMVQ